MPLFAFFNAGIAIDAGVSTSLFSSVSLGVLGGLFLGKQLGVASAAWVAIRLGLAQLPAGVNWGQIYGVALLAGIGFTMSLFVASLAFADLVLVASAKLAILIGFLLSAITGMLAIRITTLTPQCLEMRVSRIEN